MVTLDSDHSLCKSSVDLYNRRLYILHWVVSNNGKFDGSLSRLLHDELHWLDVTDQVRTIQVRRADILMSSWNSCHLPDEQLYTNICQHLRSAIQRKLTVPVPRYRLNSFGRRCFAVAGPLTWNSLPDSLRDPILSLRLAFSRIRVPFCENTDDIYSAHLKLTLFLLSYLLTCMSPVDLL